MPLLRNADKSKISKRKNPAARLTWFREQGYLPEALRNFLALMGYSLPDGREIFSFEEMVASFDWSRVNAVGPVFDLDKLRLAQRPLHPRAAGRRPGGARRRPPRAPRRARRRADRRAARLDPAATPLVQERMNLLDEAVGMLGFLLVADGGPAARGRRRQPRWASGAGDGARRRRRGARPARRRGRPPRSRRRCAPRSSTGSGSSPRSRSRRCGSPSPGAAVSPPLFESMELLGPRPRRSPGSQRADRLVLGG